MSPTVQLDTRPSESDISSPVSEPNGRGSGLTAGVAPQGVAMVSKRRVRHDVADAARLAAFSIGASTAVAALLAVCSHVAGLS